MTLRAVCPDLIVVTFHTYNCRRQRWAQVACDNVDYAAELRVCHVKKRMAGAVGTVRGSGYLLVICCPIEVNNGIFPDVTVDAVIRKYGGGKLTAVWANIGEKAYMIGEKAYMMATRMLARESWTKALVHIKRAGGA